MAAGANENEMKGVMRTCPAALAVLHILLSLEFKANVKGEPLKLTNYALDWWGVSRRQKRQALDELARRGILTYTQGRNKNPKVRLQTALCK